MRLQEPSRHQWRGRNSGTMSWMKPEYIEVPPDQRVMVSGWYAVDDDGVVLSPRFESEAAVLEWIEAHTPAARKPPRESSDFSP